MTGSLDVAVQCSSCERQNSLSARFCRHCGARLAAAAGPEPAVTGIPQPAAVRNISSSGLLPSKLSPVRRFLARARGPRHAADHAATRSELAAFLRRPPVAIAAATVAILALAGWQAHWPAALFAAKQPSAAQAGAVAGSRSSAVTSPLPSSPPTAASPPGRAAPTPAASASAASPTGAGGATGPRASGPAATVRAYIAAINHGNYAKAWRLGGRNAGVSYAKFVTGFAGTARDALKVLSVAGNVVTARLAAYQTDGTLKTFTGTYAVEDRVIAKFDVQQVS